MRGIYSFVILDMRGKLSFILARDPSGVKPLYYHLYHNKLVFGSEIKALKPLLGNLSINETAIKQYLNLGYIPEPNTAYQQIKAFRPGYFLKWSRGSRSLIKPFFKFNFQNINSNSYKKNIEKTSFYLKNAITRNLVSDVDISLSLSGGIDSSLLYFYANKEDKNILAQTISFKNHNEYDESNISRTYSKYLSGKHIVSDIEENIDLDLIDKIFLHFDQPFADTSAIPVYFINKYASKYGKVLIGGDGGDELFNGYPSQTILSYLLKYNKYSFIWNFLNKTKHYYPHNITRKISKLFNLVNNDHDTLESIYNFNSWLPNYAKLNGECAFKTQVDSDHIQNYKKIFEDEMPKKIEYKIVFEYFRKTLLSDYLRKTDMMSMINGVEWRVPMLDEDLTSFAFSIPFNQKSSFGSYKKHLRALHSQKFPKNTGKMTKSGFGIPLDSYIIADDKKHIANEILKSNSILNNYFNKPFLLKLIDQFFQYDNISEISRPSVYQRIMILYILQRWIDTN